MSKPEKELERLLRVVLPGTEFEHRVFAVGGYVRDELLGEEAHDLDVVVEMQYGAQRFGEFLVDFFGDEIVLGPIPLSLRYPVWRVKFADDVLVGNNVYGTKGAYLDMADTQSVVDGTYSLFGPLSDDFRRRDFTVNMVFKDLTDGTLVDPSGLGLADIERGILRTLPSYNEHEDLVANPKKILRAIRFALKYDWGLEPSLVETIKQSEDVISSIDAKAIRRELRKIRDDGNLTKAVGMFKELGLWDAILKTLSASEH